MSRTHWLPWRKIKAQCTSAKPALDTRMWQPPARPMRNGKRVTRIVRRCHVHRAVRTTRHSTWLTRSPECTGCSSFCPRMMAPTGSGINRHLYIDDRLAGSARIRHWRLDEVAQKAGSVPTSKPSIFSGEAQLSTCPASAVFGSRVSLTLSSPPVSGRRGDEARNLWSWKRR